MVRAVRDIAGRTVESKTTAGELIKEFQALAKRQKSGKFTLAEAAQILSDQYRTNAKTRLSTIVAAAKNGSLDAYDAATRQKKHRHEQIHPWRDYSTVKNLNDWLSATHDGLSFSAAAEFSPAHCNHSQIAADSSDETRAKKRKRS
jgi:hypothetical protein